MSYFRRGRHRATRHSLRVADIQAAITAERAYRKFKDNLKALSESMVR